MNLQSSNILVYSFPLKSLITFNTKSLELPKPSPHPYPPSQPSVEFLPLAFTFCKLEVSNPTSD
jgi:hypothetical protein